MGNLEMNKYYPYIIDNKSKEPKLVLSDNIILKTNNGFYFHVVDNQGKEISKPKVNLYNLEGYLRYNNLYNSEIHAIMIYMNAIIAGSSVKEFHTLLRKHLPMLDEFVRLTVKNRTGRDYFITYAYLISRVLCNVELSHTSPNVLLGDIVKLELHNNLVITIRYITNEGQYKLSVRLPELIKEDKNKIKSHFGVEFGYPYEKAYLGIMLNEHIRMQLLLFSVAVSGLILDKETITHFSKELIKYEKDELKQYSLDNIGQYFRLVHNLYKQNNNISQKYYTYD